VVWSGATPSERGAKANNDNNSLPRTLTILYSADGKVLDRKKKQKSKNAFSLSNSSQIKPTLVKFQPPFTPVPATGGLFSPPFNAFRLRPSTVQRTLSNCVSASLSDDRPNVQPTWCTRLDPRHKDVLYANVIWTFAGWGNGVREEVSVGGTTTTTYLLCTASVPNIFVTTIQGACIDTVECFGSGSCWPAFLHSSQLSRLESRTVQGTWRWRCRPQHAG
jgi:hypothetical protein